MDSWWRLCLKAGWYRWLSGISRLRFLAALFGAASISFKRFRAKFLDFVNLDLVTVVVEARLLLFWPNGCRALEPLELPLTTLSSMIGLQRISIRYSTRKNSFGINHTVWLEPCLWEKSAFASLFVLFRVGFGPWARWWSRLSIRFSCSSVRWYDSIFSEQWEF